MPTTLRALSFHGRVALALLVASATGCFKLDENDCESYGLCRDSLALEADKLSPDCGACLRVPCKSAAELCSADYKCNRTVRCMLKLNPLDYQECLAGLWEAGISQSKDENGAWEGDPNKLFGGCLSRCRNECERDRGDWRCVGSWNPGRELFPFTAHVAVILYRDVNTPTKRPMPAARVTRCVGLLPCDTDAGALTDDTGVAVLEIDNSTRVEGLYFAVTHESREPEFPNTYYYPGHVSNDPEQPIAIYVVSTAAVKSSRSPLIGDAAVPEADPDSGLLMEGGQVLILPDACHEHGFTSTPGVTFQARVAGQLVPRCKQESGLDPVIPCIWYGEAINGFPDLELDQTQGWGGGIVGLPDGEHDIRACDLDGGTLAFRENLRMETGWLTIARTWPLSTDEAAHAVPCDPPE